MCNKYQMIRKHVPTSKSIRVSSWQLVRIGVLFLFLTALPTFSLLHAVEIEYGAGSNYRSFGMSKSAIPSQCRNACLNDPRCKAWTFVKIGIQGPNPRCWLKDSVPQAEQNVCCVSGAASSLKRKLEYNIDRPGSDYKNFFIDDNPLSCLKACNEDTKCKAFTYVKKNIQENRAKCWLKYTVLAKKKSKCCISGIFQ